MKTTQAEFRAAVFNPDISVPASLTDGLKRPAGKRFDVYRNNVVLSLKEALSESFPVIAKLLGPQNFSALADIRRFCQSSKPSRTWPIYPMLRVWN